MQQLLLNVDWLAVSVRYRVKEWRLQGSRYSFINYDGTNVWRKRRIFYNQYAEKVATVLYEPKSSVIDGRAGLIEIANEWLYHGKSPSEIIEELRELRSFDIVGLSRLDLCVDYNPTEEQRTVARMLSEGAASVCGKRNDSQFNSVNTSPFLADAYQGKRICHCMSWGHKTTSVKWKHYYKTKELLDDCGGKMLAKPYIVDCWNEAGLDVRDVWRLEVSLKHCNQLHFRGEPITYDVMHRFPRELYMALYTERFTIRKNEGHMDRSNDTRLDFLPIGEGHGIRVAPPAATTIRNGRITLLRHLLQSLDAEEVVMDDASRERVLEHVVAIVENDGLQNYFRAMVGTDLYSWVESVRVKAYAMLETHAVPVREDLWSIMERGRTFKDDTNKP